MPKVTATESTVTLVSSNNYQTPISLKSGDTIYIPAYGRQGKVVKASLPDRMPKGIHQVDEGE